MKKVLFIAVIALLGLGTANAQSVKFGVKAGVNLSKIKVDVLEKSDVSFGFNFGLFTEIGLSDKFFLQPEVLFSTQGAKFENSENGDVESATFKINYLNHFKNETKHFKIERFNIVAICSNCRGTRIKRRTKRESRTTR